MRFSCTSTRLTTGQGGLESGCPTRAGRFGDAPVRHSGTVYGTVYGAPRGAPSPAASSREDTRRLPRGGLQDGRSGGSENRQGQTIDETEPGRPARCEELPGAQGRWHTRSALRHTDPRDATGRDRRSRTCEGIRPPASGHPKDCIHGGAGPRPPAAAPERPAGLSAGAEPGTAGTPRPAGSIPNQRDTRIRKTGHRDTVNRGGSAPRCVLPP